MYQDVRVVIPQLETSMSVEYDQFSTVGDVLAYVQCISGIWIMDLPGWYSSRRPGTTIKSKGVGTQYMWLKCRYKIMYLQLNN